MKKPVKTSIQLQQELDKVTFIYKNQLELNEKLNNENKELKENFAKIRKNYDREKDRLDMALRALDNATNKI